jgi:hypothetical protein
MGKLNLALALTPHFMLLNNLIFLWVVQAGALNTSAIVDTVLGTVLRRVLPTGTPRVVHATSITNGTFFKSLIKHQHIAHDIDYKQQRTAVEGIYSQLEASMVHAQQAGYSLPCSYQISTELQHWIHYTDDWHSTAQRLADFNRSLGETNQSAHIPQQPDGSWAGCTDILFVKLGLSQDQLYPYFLDNLPLKHPLTFVKDSVLGSSKTLIPYVQSLLVSDITRTGTNRRQELNTVLCFVSKLVSMREWVTVANTGITLSDEYVSAYLAFLRSAQDDTYGYWGARYEAEGEVYASMDLSISFHVIKYWLSNATPATAHLVSAPLPPLMRLNAIANTTMAIRLEPYPYGWGLSQGAHNSSTGWNSDSNHNDFDVVTLLTAGWDELSQDARTQAAGYIGEMVDWAIGPASLRRDNTSASLHCDGADSIGDCYYFFTAFLKVVGYWTPGPKFWTKKDFHDVLLCMQLKDTYWRFNMTNASGIGWSALLLLSEYC